MATIQTAVRITDGMSSPFQKIRTSIDTVINSFEKMEAVTSTAINTSSIQQGRAAIEQTDKKVDEVVADLDRADQSQKRFTNDIRGGTSAAGGLQSKIMAIAASAGIAFGGKQIISLSDQLTSSTARMSLMNDNLQTTAELQDKIFAASERSRGSYIDTMATVSKLGILAGEAFSSNDEMIRFTELMNKNFVVGGASQTEQTSAMYQLTQAMAAGKLQGDEYRSIIENAPLLATAIKDYMINVQGAEGGMKDWAAAGLLTADVIKEALFASAETTEARFSTMPMTFEQVWTSFKNKSIKAFEPILTKINEIANNDAFQTMVDGFIGGMVQVSNVALTVFEVIGNIAGFFYDNWSGFAPIIAAIVAAMVLYNVVSLITTGINGALALAEGVKAAALLLSTGHTLAYTAAQTSLNAALYACPITWIILAIILIIVAIYTVIAAINTVAGTTVSATGVIFGVFAALGAGLYDIFLGILNIVLGVFNGIMQILVTVVNFLANCFVSPISSVIYLFQGLADAVLSVLEGVAGALDSLFGSNLADAVGGWRTSLKGMADDLAAKTGETYTAAVKWDNITTDTLGLQPIKMTDAYDSGYKVGESVQSAVTNFDISSLLGDTTALDDITASGDATAANTGAVADSMDATEEDLKYLRDIAEQDVINRFTTAEIQVNLGGVNNNVSAGTDLDGVVSYLETKLYETMEIAAEGVHS